MAMMARLLRGALIAAAFSTLAACASFGGGRGAPLRPPAVTDPAPIVAGTMRPYQIRGRWYRPAEQPNYDEVGLASWYGAQHNGRPTSTGERFDMAALTAAHKTLPLPSLVEVTNRANGRRVILRVNDRGPFVDSRIIDLSRAAAEELGLLSQGVGEVRVRYVGRAPRTGGGATMRRAEAAPSAAKPTPTARALERSAPVISEASAYWVQAGAYSDRRAARRIAERLGDRASVQDIRSDGQFLFRVIVGPWPDANAAEQARQAVIARGFGDALLISGG